MKLALWSLGLIGFVVAGCGAPTCEDVVRHHQKVKERMGGQRYGGSRPDPERIRRGIASCTDEKWSTQLKECILAARDREGLDRCEPYYQPR